MAQGEIQGILQNTTALQKKDNFLCASKLPKLHNL